VSFTLNHHHAGGFNGFSCCAAPPVPLLDSTAAPATIGLFSHPTFSRIGDAALKPSAFGMLPLAGKETQFMMTNPGNGKSSSLFQRKATLVMLAATILLPSIQRTEAATNVVVWDTGSRLVDAADVESRARWRQVPSELFIMEADPSKAASDPGYYGREYSFKGDAVVENRSLVAVFWSAKGRVVIVPLQTTTQPSTNSHFEILRNADDQVALEVSFSAKGTPDASAILVFDKTGIVEIKPMENMSGVSLRSPLEYGVVPGFIGDDLIYGASEYPSANKLYVPAEHVFVGLRSGGDTELLVTWPNGKLPMSLKLGNGPQGNRLIESIDFGNSGQSIYLAPLTAPGIWHKETLAAAYLEKDVKIDWKRPFPARWKTQLYEAEVKTTFAFRESKGQIWRGVPGSYDYPVWFDGDGVFYHLSKKVPPKGESLIYFLEGQDTPLSFPTPVDIMKATLGRQMCDPILDIAGRKLRTHHRRGGDGVHRACTCGCTEVMQAVFEKGEEVTRKDYIGEALGDMNYFVRCHVERIDEYRRFADDLIKFLQAQGSSSPELKPFLDGLEQIAGQIPQEYSVQKENMKSPEYVHELTRQTLALTSTKNTNNLNAYMELLKAWRGMGGAQDYVVAQCHMITRKLCQESGYGCAEQPKAVDVAREIRSRCRQVLRNPDGYEIWANY
jgi:hypothetical protein